MTGSSSVSWWKGERGEWYALAQVLLLALVFFGPRNLAGWPPWPGWLAGPARVAGMLLMAAGFALLLAGGVNLGRADLTPLPYPRSGGVLRQAGAYRIVRHPMYAGGVAMGFGWALLAQGGLTLVYSVGLLVFADIKATLEERWLVGAYPDYAAYRRRVRKLIPFLY